MEERVESEGSVEGGGMEEEMKREVEDDMVEERDARWKREVGREGGRE